MHSSSKHSHKYSNPSREGSGGKKKVPSVQSTEAAAKLKALGYNSTLAGSSPSNHQGKKKKKKTVPIAPVAYESSTVSSSDTSDDSATQEDSSGSEMDTTVVNARSAPVVRPVKAPTEVLNISSSGSDSGSGEYDSGDEDSEEELPVPTPLRPVKDSPSKKPQLSLAKLNSFAKMAASPIAAIRESWESDAEEESDESEFEKDRRSSQPHPSSTLSNTQIGKMSARIGGVVDSAIFDPFLSSSKIKFVVFYVLEDSKGLELQLKLNQYRFDDEEVVSAISIVEKIELAQGTKLSPLTQVAYKLCQVDTEGHEVLGSTLSSLAAVGSLRSSSLAVENRGDLLYFIESPVDMKLCMRLSTKPSTRTPNISPVKKVKAESTVQTTPSSHLSQMHAELLASANLVVPDEIYSKSTGAIDLRNKIQWIIDRAKEYNVSRMAVVKFIGRSDVWWRKAQSAFEIEQKYELSKKSSFKPFLTSHSTATDPAGSFYFAYCRHYQLCQHDDLTCPFYSYLVMYYTTRSSSSTTTPYPRLPVSNNVDDDVWRLFTVGMAVIALENRWVVSIEEMNLRTKPVINTPALKCETVGSSEVKKRQKSTPTEILKSLNRGIEPAKGSGGAEGSESRKVKRTKEVEWDEGASLERKRNKVKKSSSSKRSSLAFMCYRIISNLRLRPLLLCSIISVVHGAELLQTTVDRIQLLWPGVTLLDTIQLSQNLLLNTATLQLLDQQSQTSLLRNPVLSSLASILFNPSDMSFAPRLPASPHYSSFEERSTILELAQALSITQNSLTGGIPRSPRPKPTRRLISTDSKCCERCGSTLRCEKAPKAVWILHPAMIEIAACLILVCRKCKAIHHPTYTEFKQNDVRIWSYHLSCEFIKIGARIFATRSFVVAYSKLLMTNHVSFGSFARLYSDLYRPQEEWQITSDHVYRCYVLHSALELATESNIRFTTLASPTTKDLVALCLSAFLSSKTIPAAEDHQCPECTRYARNWNEEYDAGGLGVSEFVQDKECERLIEDATIDTDRIVNMAVVDGVTIGHKTCAVLHCRSEPLNYTTNRFCLDHAAESELCGVNGCTNELRMDDDNFVANQACDLPAHQRIWTSFLSIKGRENYLGFKRVFRRSNTDNAARVLAEIHEESDSESEDSLTQEKPGNSFSFGKTWAIGIYVYACGTIGGWTKFCTKEEPEEVLTFIEDVTADMKYPTYLAYDRSCHLLTTIVGDESLHHWLDRTRFIVDAFHFRRHSPNDVICRTYCDPSSTSVNENLVVPMISSSGYNAQRRGRKYRRVFNTGAAEHVNSWLTGFGKILRPMTAANFDFVVSMILRAKSVERMQHLTSKYDGVKIG